MGQNSYNVKIFANNVTDFLVFFTLHLELGSSAVRAPSVAAAANMPFYAKIAVISTG